MTATTLRQMTAGLRGTLRRRGLGGLGGATQTLATPVPGRLEQLVYTPSATRQEADAARQGTADLRGRRHGQADAPPDGRRPAQAPERDQAQARDRDPVHPADRPAGHRRRPPDRAQAIRAGGADAQLACREPISPPLGAPAARTAAGATDVRRATSPTSVVGMVTADEIGTIPIFATLGPAERERLSRAAADVTLVEGEYAAHEGGERALFAVLEGRIEAVKLVDGMGRVVGGATRGTSSARCRSRSGPCSPSGSARPSRRASCGSSRTTSTRSPPSSRRSPGRSTSSRSTGSADRAGCRASPPPRPRPAPSSSAAVGTRRARSCAASSTATRSRSSGSCPMRPTQRSTGAARCRPTGTGRRSASSTARRSCGRSSAAWPSCSASRRRRRPRTTTSWSWAPGPRAWRPRCTAPRRA